MWRLAARAARMTRALLILARKEWRRHRQSGLCRHDWQRGWEQEGVVATCSRATTLAYFSSAGIEKSIIIIIIIWALAACWVPHLARSPERFTVATIALFSTSEQTHCALVECEYEWESLYTARLEYPPKWCTYNVLTQRSHLKFSSFFPNYFQLWFVCFLVQDKWQAIKR